MPLSKYNAAFGGKKGSAAKAKRAMLKEYGAKKGTQVFYATKNKNLSKQRGEPTDQQKLAEAFRKRSRKRKKGKARGA